MAKEILEFELKADTAKAKKDIKRFEDDIDGFRRRIKDKKAIKLSMNVAEIKWQIDAIKKKLKEVDDEKVKIELEADTIRLKQELTQANRELRNYVRTGKKDVSVLGKLFQGVANDIDKTRLELLKLGKSTKQLDKLEKELEELNRDFKAGKINVQQYGSQLNKLQGNIKNTGGAFWSLKKTLKWVAGFFIVGLGIREFWRSLKKMSDIAISFQSAFAWIRKTLDGTEEDFKKIEKGIISLSKEIPVAVEELSKIAEIGGQLWVAKEDIIDFTETVAKIWVTTNLTVEEAATAFARIAEVTGESITNLDKMASAVVWLGNNFATTEKEIVNFANRISWTWSLVWLTTADIFGIWTAFTAVGIEAESWGTAVQKWFLKINEAVINGWQKLDDFAKLTGKTAEEFARSWRDDAGLTFVEFVEALGKSGDGALKILNNLLGSDIRLTRAFLTTAKAGDLLRRAVKKSNEEFEKNNALNEEANKRFSTDESRIQALENRWKAIGNTIWKFINKIWIPWVEKLTTWLEKVIKFTIEFSGAIKNLTIAIFALLGAKALFGLASLLRLLPGLFWSVTVGATASAWGIKLLATTIAIASRTISASIPVFYALATAIAVATKALQVHQEVQGIQDNITRNSANASKDLTKAITKNIKSIKDLREENTELRKSDTKNSKAIIEANNKKIEAEESGLETLKLLNKKSIRIQEGATKSEIENIDKLIGYQTQKTVELQKLAGINDDVRKSFEESIDIPAGAEDPDFSGISWWASKASKATDELKKVVKELWEQNKTTYGDINKEIDTSIKSIEKYIDEIEKVSDKIKDLKNDATKSIREINDELNNLSKSSSERLAERSLVIDKERKDVLEDIIKATAENNKFITLQNKLKTINEKFARGVSDTKRISLEKERVKIIERIETKLLNSRKLTTEEFKLKEKIIELDIEKGLINENTTKKIRNQIKEISKLSETEKELQETASKESILKERKAIFEAIKNGEEVNLNEIKDLKNLKLAEELVEKQTAFKLELEAIKSNLENQKSEYQQLTEDRKTFEADWTKFFGTEINKQKDFAKELQAELKRVIALQKQARISGVTLWSTGLNTNTTTGEETQTIDNSRTVDININATNDIDIDLAVEKISEVIK